MRNYDGSFSRSRDAFADWRFAAIEVYRPPFWVRWWRRCSYLLAVIVIFGALGALIGWGGRPL